MRVLVAVLCLVPLVARAAELDCNNITSPVEEATCSSDIAGSKKRLNAAYGRLAKKVYPDFLPLLEKAQKAWLDYRNAACAYDAEPLMGGTMITSARIACTADMNNKRAAELEEDMARWQ